MYGLPEEKSLVALAVLVVGSCCHFHRCCGNEGEEVRLLEISSLTVPRWIREGEPRAYDLFLSDSMGGSIDPLLITLELLLLWR